MFVRRTSGPPIRYSCDPHSSCPLLRGTFRLMCRWGRCLSTAKSSRSEAHADVRASDKWTSNQIFLRPSWPMHFVGRCPTDGSILTHSPIVMCAMPQAILSAEQCMHTPLGSPPFHVGGYRRPFVLSCHVPRSMAPQGDSEFLWTRAQKDASTFCEPHHATGDPSMHSPVLTYSFFHHPPTYSHAIPMHRQLTLV